MLKCTVPPTLQGNCDNGQDSGPPYSALGKLTRATGLRLRWLRAGLGGATARAGRGIAGARVIAVGRVRPIVFGHIERHSLLDLLAIAAEDLLLDLRILNIDEGAILRVLDAVIDEFLAAGAHSWNREVFAKILRGYEAGVALRSLYRRGGGVRGLKSVNIEFVELTLEVVVVGEEADGLIVLIDGHKAVVCLLLAVFVDESTAEGAHLIAIEGLNFVEEARCNAVASILTVLLLVSLRYLWSLYAFTTSQVLKCLERARCDLQRLGRQTH